MRQPYQTIILPYNRGENGNIQYLIARRSSKKIWQFFSGGGETEDQNLMATAQRELQEEACLSGRNWIKLDSMCTLPKVLYEDHKEWNEPHVIPEYCFATEIIKETPKMSEEHIEFRWCTFEEATNLLEFDSNKIALWELSRRLENSS